MVSACSSGSSGSGSPGDDIRWDDSDGDGVYRVKRCFCETKLKIQIDWSPENPGRRFVTCPYRKEFNCGFFEWIDPTFPTQATRVIGDLLQRRSNLESNTSDLMKVISAQNAEIQRLAVDFEEAKGLAEFISKLDADRQRQLEVAGKEMNSVLLSLKWQKIISAVVIAILSIGLVWFFNLRY